MKFGQKPRKEWRSSQELDRSYNPLNRRLNRLMILDHVWNQLVGNKTGFGCSRPLKKIRFTYR